MLVARAGGIAVLELQSYFSFPAAEEPDRQSQRTTIDFVGPLLLLAVADHEAAGLRTL